MSTERFSDFGFAQQDEDKDNGVIHEVCASCGESNRVLPPAGYKLTPVGERRRRALPRESAEAVVDPVRIFREAYRMQGENERLDVAPFFMG